MCIRARDNSQVTEGVFISREAKDGYYYTRLEWHKWDGTTYYISNEAFRSEYKEKVPGSTEPQEMCIRDSWRDVYGLLFGSY